MNGRPEQHRFISYYYYSTSIIAFGPTNHTYNRPYADCHMNTELIKAGRQYRFWFYTTYSTADLHMRYNSERGYYTLSAYTSEL